LILYHVFYAFMPSITYIWTTFVKATLSTSIIFRVKNTFEPNVLKWIINISFMSSSPFALLIINLKILSNFQKEWCTFGKRKDVWKKHGLTNLEVWVFWTCNFFFWFLSSFEHVKFVINEKYSKKNYDNPNYYVSLAIF